MPNPSNRAQRRSSQPAAVTIASLTGGCGGPARTDRFRVLAGDAVVASELAPRAENEEMRAMTNKIRGFAVAAAGGLLLVAGAANALPSIDIIWKDNQSESIGTPTVGSSSTIVADIVLRGDGDPANSVIGVFITIDFDAAELQAVSAFELGTVNLPGMGNSLSPISTTNFNIDNTAGFVQGFDQANASAPGLSALQSRTLGSVTFHVLNPTGDANDIDVIGNTSNAGVDGITFAPGEPGSATFSGASLTGPVAPPPPPPPPPPPVPEPTTALLIVAGLLGLSYAGKRSSRG